MNGSIFQNFLKFEPLSQNWLKFKKIFEKSRDFAQNWANWYMNGSPFLEKNGICMVYLKILWWHFPTKTKLELPPGAVDKAMFELKASALFTS